MPAGQGARPQPRAPRPARHHLAHTVAPALTDASVRMPSPAGAPETPLDFERFVNPYRAESHAPFASQG